MTPAMLHTIRAELAAMRAQIEALDDQLAAAEAAETNASGNPAAPPPRRAATSRRRQLRIALGAAAIVSVDDAASRLPMDDSDARAWLRRHKLVRDLDGRAVVRWADVLAALDAPPEQARRAASGPIPRIRLP